MNNGWIKLHRKILENDALFSSEHTFKVWCFLLLKADMNGIVKTGRYLISEWLRIKPSSLYQTLKRLEDMKMITQESNNKMTTIKILNWSIYQSKQPISGSPENGQYKNKKDEIQEQDNTIQEYKNKEYKNIKYVTTFPIEDFKDIDATEKQLRAEAEQALNWLISEGETKSNYRAFLRKWFTGSYGKFKKRVSQEPTMRVEFDPAGIARVAQMKKDLMKIKGMN
jgi:hypothetical protein